MRDRQALLDEIGDRKISLEQSFELLKSWALAYSYLGFLGGSFSMMFISIQNKNLRLAYMFMVPVIVATIAYFVIKSRTKIQRVTYDQKGFVVIEGNHVVFEQSWGRLSEIRTSRDQLIFRRVTGEEETFKLPDIKRTRDYQRFLDLLKTFYRKQDHSSRINRLAKILTFSAFLGLIGSIIHARPAFLAKDYDGPIGSTQYFDLAFWILSSFLLFGGIIGLLILSANWMEKRFLKKSRERSSSFGPTVQQHLDASSNWPKLVELEEGKHYRYMDPEGVRLAIKEQIEIGWLGTGGPLLFGLAGIPVLVYSPTRPADVAPKIFIGIGCLFLIALGFYLGNEVRVRKKLYLAIDDQISLRNGLLVVERNGITATYPRKPFKVMPDNYPQKETKKPFGRVERFGSKPDIYIMDRRYLLEFNPGSREENPG